MAFKSFREQDLLYTTLKAYPEYNFIINDKKIYFQKERTSKGNLSSEAIKHVPTGSISLYELNIDRGDKTRSVIEDDLVSLTVPLRDSSGLKIRPFSMTRADRIALPTSTIDTRVTYPLSATIGRIFVKKDAEFRSVYSQDRTVPIGGRNGVEARDRFKPKHARIDGRSKNRKYISALATLISQPDDLQEGSYDKYKLEEVNMICIPGVFSGSGVKKGSIKLDYYITGSIVATAEDKFSNGKMICTEGPDSVKGTEIGMVLYHQGLIMLTSSISLHSSYTDYYYNPSALTPPTWLNFGSGLAEPGESDIDISNLTNKNSYVVKFKGTNKIPTLTMFAFSERGEHNYSNNPTFLENDRLEGEKPLLGEYSLTSNSFSEKELNVKKINKSDYHDANDSFKSTTYISKVGIYDEDKNLIAVASLANPIKKTEKRDFMVKMKLDF